MRDQYSLNEELNGKKVTSPVPLKNRPLILIESRYCVTSGSKQTQQRGCEQAISTSWLFVCCSHPQKGQRLWEVPAEHPLVDMWNSTIWIQFKIFYLNMTVTKQRCHLLKCKYYFIGNNHIKKQPIFLFLFHVQQLLSHCLHNPSTYPTHATTYQCVPGTLIFLNKIRLKNRTVKTTMGHKTVLWAKSCWSMEQQLKHNQMDHTSPSQYLMHNYLFREQASLNPFKKPHLFGFKSA